MDASIQIKANRFSDIKAMLIERRFPNVSKKDMLHKLSLPELCRDSKNKVQGILHLHDILGKGAFKFNEI